ncbi:hypothetical protein [Ramlibacter sp.]|uniref:hypothetical protein n=1 Tax=Ramlibacter sp. TaxID=1917967 RepID=UPI0018507FE1|nr:hypothetical protein [Ramlibacter sp.]MBA2674955.1 hypothetical protein [Ramlibacter sp.]
MKKSSPSDRNPQQPSGKLPAAGHRSGKGASSIVPYLDEAANSKPAPLEPEAHQPAAKRPRWRW